MTVTITPTDITKLLNGRQVVENYRAQLVQGIVDSAKLISGLQALGFNDIQAFYTFNDQMCITALQTLNIQGKCDLCKGYAGIPNCKAKFGTSSCYSTGIALTATTIHRAILIRIKLGDFAITGNWTQSIANLKAGADANSIYWFCRPNGGLYINVKQMTPTTAGNFSLTWK